jgi:L-asparaginase
VASTDAAGVSGATPPGRPHGGLPAVTLISLGGTIASTPTPQGGAAPRLTGADLVAAVPELGRVADVEVVSLAVAPSCEIGFRTVVDVARRIGAEAARGACGVVVTQGTDTLEEVAFALDLLTDDSCAVVLTGAMRPAAAPGADGPANLLAAVRVAIHPAARGCGALVVFNDEVHAARCVQKRNTSSPAAFRSFAGPVGWVTEDRVRLLHRPLGRLRVPLGPDPRDAFVALHKVTLGDDGRLLAGVAGAGCDGLVVEALGGGHVPSAMVPALADLAARMPVVLTSRTGSGENLRHTYGYPGSEMDLLGRGLIAAGALDGPKARVLLTLLLMAGAGRAEVERAFAAVASGEGWA